jgi:hypothetical protein
MVIHYNVGIKRAREDDDDDKPEGEKPKIDPQSVPDPEFVEGWSDEAIQAVCKDMFVLPEENTNVTLDPYNSDLHFVIESNGISGYSLGTEEGFTYMKASTKATCGVKNGCYFYECKVCVISYIGAPATKHHIIHIVRLYSVQARFDHFKT